MKATVDFFYGRYDKYRNPIEGIVAFLTDADFPMIALSLLYACLSISRQDLSSEGMEKKFKIPHDLWVNSIA